MATALAGHVAVGPGVGHVAERAGQRLQAFVLAHVGQHVDGWPVDARRIQCHLARSGAGRAAVDLEDKEMWCGRLGLACAIVHFAFHGTRAVCDSRRVFHQMRVAALTSIWPVRAVRAVMADISAATVD